MENRGINSPPDPRHLTARQRVLRDQMAERLICYLTGEPPGALAAFDGVSDNPDRQTRARDARIATHKARWEMHIAKWTYRLATQLMVRGYARPVAMGLARKMQHHLDACSNCWAGDELSPCHVYRALGSTHGAGTSDSPDGDRRDRVGELRKAS